VDGVSGQSLFPHQWGSGTQTTMLKRDSGLEYTLCGLAVKCPDAFVPLFTHGFTPRHCLGFERAALVMLAMAIGSRFHRNISGHIVAAS
jgi:hypothetical protein